MIKSPLYKKSKLVSGEKLKKEILDLGFIRFEMNGKLTTVNDEIIVKDNVLYDIDIIVDRLVVLDYNKDESDVKRLKDSLELAFRVSK